MLVDNAQMLRLARDLTPSMLVRSLAGVTPVSIPTATDDRAQALIDLRERSAKRKALHRVCTGTSCFVATLGGHVARAETALGVRCGECSPDGSVSLQGAHCLGYCYASPAALDPAHRTGRAGSAGCDSGSTSKP